MTRACRRSLFPPLSDTHSSWGEYIKTFNCQLFYAGDNPWALLFGKDIFWGQLGDESPRERNNRTRQRKGKKGRTSKTEISDYRVGSCICSCFYLLPSGEKTCRTDFSWTWGHSALANVNAQSAREINYMCGAFVADPSSIQFTLLE